MDSPLKHGEDLEPGSAKPQKTRIACDHAGPNSLCSGIRTVSLRFSLCQIFIVGYFSVSRMSLSAIKGPSIDWTMPDQQSQCIVTMPTQILYQYPHNHSLIGLGQASIIIKQTPPNIATAIMCIIRKTHNPVCKHSNIEVQKCSLRKCLLDLSPRNPATGRPIPIPIPNTSSERSSCRFCSMIELYRTRTKDLTLAQRRQLTDLNDESRLVRSIEQWNRETVRQAFGDFIESLPRIDVAGKAEEDHTCCICLDEFGSNNRQGVSERAIRLPCGHALGEGCARKYLGAHNSACPLCRTVVY